MIDAGGVDAVVLATPASAHLEDARCASEAGIAALIEKPPAATAEEGAALARLEPSPVIGFNRRFEPGMARLRRGLAGEGRLELSLTLHHPSGSWRSHLVADDALLSLGPHLIDLARWLSGRNSIEAVRALEMTATRARLQLRLADATATLSCATDLPAEDTIWARLGRRELGRVAGGVVRRGLRRLAHPVGAGALVRSLALQLEAFARRVRGESVEQLGSAEDGAEVMAAVEATRRSDLAGGAWFPVSGPG